VVAGDQHPDKTKIIGRGNLHPNQTTVAGNLHPDMTKTTIVAEYELAQTKNEDFIEV